MGANIDNIISFFDKSFKSFKVNRFPTTYVRNVSRNNFVVSINHNFYRGVSCVDKQLSFRKFHSQILPKIVFSSQKASFRVCRDWFWSWFWGWGWVYDWFGVGLGLRLGWSWFRVGLGLALRLFLDLGLILWLILFLVLRLTLFLVFKLILVLILGFASVYKYY